MLQTFAIPQNVQMANFENTQQYLFDGDRFPASNFTIDSRMDQFKTIQ